MPQQNDSSSARRPNAGFTMVELLVALVIVVVIVTISIPTVASMTSSKNVLRKEARRLMSLMQEARTAAMNRKLRIDIIVDPEFNEVRAEEAAYLRTLSADTIDGRDEHNRELRDVIMSNRFSRVLIFDEDILLDGFAVDDIESPNDPEDPFQRQDPATSTESFLAGTPEGPHRAISFTHFGGSDGGGISLSREATRLDIAVDILTGRPMLVRRRASQPESSRP